MSNGDQVELFLRLLLALGLGSAIGLERDFRGHHAGVRTLGLVCLGAAIFGEASDFYGDSRIAAGVVQGIGFLGAGLIIVRGVGVVGATTAVTVWAVAGIGLLVSLEAWLAALLTSTTIIVALELSPVSDWILRHGRPHRDAPPRLAADESATEPAGDPQG